MFSGLNQLASVDDLLRRQFRLAPKFRSAVPRGLGSGAGALLDKALFKLGKPAKI